MNKKNKDYYNYSKIMKELKKSNIIKIKKTHSLILISNKIKAKISLIQKIINYQAIYSKQIILKNNKNKNNF